VSWAYYVQSGVQPDCDDNPDETAAGCAPVAQGAGTPSIWNPLPSFTDVKQDGQLGDVKNLSATDGRPDPRPDVRGNASILGNLAADFDFNAPPRPPVLLPAHPSPGPPSTP
jgi:hypothetical protein